MASNRNRMRFGLAATLIALAACGPSGGAPARPAPPADEKPTPDDAPDAGCADCGPAAPARAPLRRLTRYEYNNTIHDLFADTTQPANRLPADQLGNGFGNDADALSTSALLVEQYAALAEDVAERATRTPQALKLLAPCAAAVKAENEEACTRTIITSLAPRVFRRPLESGEADDLFGLARDVRATDGASFATSISALIQVLLQSPEFLYRPEFGVPDEKQPALRRPTGHEMATRLSYFFWGTTPDLELVRAAEAGELSANEGVLEQAQRLLDDPRSHLMVSYFFDSLLPINGLTDLARDPELYPAFSSDLGRAMHTETQNLLEYVIFQGEGTWPSAFTAPYTFVDEQLADFYGISGVTGRAFQKVNLPHPEQRLGLLLQAGMLTGTVTSNQSNPVLRGSFIVNKLMCMHIALPTDPKVLAQVKLPADTSGATARVRFEKHSKDPVCASCHRTLDPPGFALENFDAIGQYRERENGVVIDASGTLPGTSERVSGPVDLAKKLAKSEAVQRCFATHWMNFAYGRTLGNEESGTQTAVQAAFHASGYNVKQLLLALTQSDAFLYLPAQTEASDE